MRPAVSRMLGHAKEILRSLMFSGKNVPCQNSIQHSVCIMPYRTNDNVIDGVVITFNDIAAVQKLEARLQRTPTKRGL
jgi:hypothetical protein